ncbi:MAG: metallophosphoesterase [Deltaproteobacteria bacterium]|jgi:predicted phosphodiesterase|nr:metallophosphoesterase [Deltaproteobacteria bacterium]
MIWVIGDIHGMIRPLKRILNAIQLHHETVEPVEKIIFLGDYIDHGYNSKEVIDLILDLQFPKVLLLGNHEDMALMYFLGEPLYAHWSPEPWKHNGGEETIFSLKSTEDASRRGVNGLSLASSQILENRRHGIDDKYFQFLLNLTPSHREVIDWGSGQLGFSFFHALPRYDQPLATQLIKTRPEFLDYLKTELKYTYLSADLQFSTSNKYRNKKKTTLTADVSFIWNRDYSFRYSYGSDVIIHGHTPTINYRTNYNSDSMVAKGFLGVFQKYPLDSRLPFLYSRDKSSGNVWPDNIMDYNPLLKNGRLKFDCGQNGAVEAINIDTGAVFEGGALTALGLSAKMLAKNELLALTTLTMEQDQPAKRNYFVSSELEPTIPVSPTVLKRVIWADRLGVDLNAPENGLFPYETLHTERLDDLSRQNDKDNT